MNQELCKDCEEARQWAIENEIGSHPICRECIKKLYLKPCWETHRLSKEATDEDLRKMYEGGDI